MKYILNVLIAIDQLVNALIGGYPDETLSASAWLGEQQGKFFPCIFRPLIDFLFLPIERNHCANAYFSEFKGTQRP
jgi:hypothetical protein